MESHSAMPIKAGKKTLSRRDIIYQVNMKKYKEVSKKIFHGIFTKIY